MTFLSQRYRPAERGTRHLACCLGLSLALGLGCADTSPMGADGAGDLGLGDGPRLAPDAADPPRCENGLMTPEVVGTGQLGSLAVDVSGKVHLLYDAAGSAEPSTGRMTYAINHGGIWTTEELPWKGRCAAMAIEPAGHGFFSFVDLDEPTVKVGTNRSGTWEVEVAGPYAAPDSSCDTAIAVHEGKISVAYFDQLEAAALRGTLRFAGNAAGEWVNSTIASTVSWPPSLSRSFALDGTGGAHVAFRSTEGEATIGYATNRSGSWVLGALTDHGSIAPIADRGVGGIALAIGPSAPHLTYCLETGGSFAPRYGKHVAGNWATEDIVIQQGDPIVCTGGDDTHSSIAVSPTTGAAHLVTGWKYGNITYATNHSGAWVAQTVDKLSLVRALAIALDGQGRVHIAFGSKGGDTVNYVRSCP